MEKIILSCTYIDFNEYCTNEHSEAMEDISKSVKKGRSYCDVSLAMMIAVMRMNVQHTNYPRRETKLNRIVQGAGMAQW